VILNCGLSHREQRAFDILLDFFKSEDNAERKALVLSREFTQRAGRSLATSLRKRLACSCRRFWSLDAHAMSNTSLGNAATQ